MKKLNRFNKSNKKKKFIVIGAFLLTGLLIVGISYAVYQKEDEVRFINAKVGEFETSRSDIELAMTLDGVDINVPPSKGYYNVTIDCDHADGSWDMDEWLAKIGNIQSNRVKCNVNFESTLAGKVELGDYIEMTPTSTSYTAPADLTGCLDDADCTQATIDPSELNLWRVIKKNDDGTVDMVSEHVSSRGVRLYGLVGYANLVKTLDLVSKEYTDNKHVKDSRVVGYKDQTMAIANIEYTAASSNPFGSWTGSPWLGESCPESGTCGSRESEGGGDVGFLDDIETIFSVLGTLVATEPDGTPTSWVLSSRFYAGNTVVSLWGFGIRGVDKDGEKVARYLGYFNEDGTTKAVRNYASHRVVVTLSLDSTIEGGDGKSADTAYQLN